MITPSIKVSSTQPIQPNAHMARRAEQLGRPLSLALQFALPTLEDRAAVPASQKIQVRMIKTACEAIDERKPPTPDKNRAIYMVSNVLGRAESTYVNKREDEPPPAGKHKEASAVAHHRRLGLVARVEVGNNGRSNHSDNEGSESKDAEGDRVAATNGGAKVEHGITRVT